MYFFIDIVCTVMQRSEIWGHVRHEKGSSWVVFVGSSCCRAGIARPSLQDCTLFSSSCSVIIANLYIDMTQYCLTYMFSIKLWEGGKLLKGEYIFSHTSAVSLFFLSIHLKVILGPHVGSKSKHPIKQCKLMCTLWLYVFGATFEIRPYSKNSTSKSE